MQNFGLMGIFIRFRLPKLLLVGVAMTKPFLLPHPHVVNNAHLETAS